MRRQLRSTTAPTLSYESNGISSKNVGASRYEIGRSLKHTREQLMDAFCGRVRNDGDGSISNSEDSCLKKCDSVLVQKYINKAHKFADGLIAEDKQFNGTIRNIVVKDQPMTDVALSEEEGDILSEPAELLDQSEMFFAGISLLHDDELIEINPHIDDSDCCFSDYVCDFRTERARICDRIRI